MSDQVRVCFLSSIPKSLPPNLPGMAVWLLPEFHFGKGIAGHKHAAKRGAEWKVGDSLTQYHALASKAV